jgi:hypothetical protein
VFPQLQTLVLRNVHDSDVNDLIPYMSSIRFIDKLTLNRCPLNKASTFICEYLLNNSMKNRLTSCILHSNDQKDGIFLHEHLPSSYQPQHSLTYLRIDVRDFATLKYLLIFLPKLSTLGKIESLFLTYYFFFSYSYEPIKETRNHLITCIFEKNSVFST